VRLYGQLAALRHTMSPSTPSMPHGTDESRGVSARPSPVAIIGVLGIVVFSVGLGVLGPQIVRRGSVEVGLPLSALLDKIHVFYQTEAFLRLRGSSAAPSDADTVVVDEALVRSVVEERFGPDTEVVTPDTPRLKLVDVRKDVEIEPFEQPAVVVVYREQLPENAQVRPADVMVLYMPVARSLRGVHARNEFGVSEPLREGELILRRITRGGGQTWIVFWFQQDLMYFLVAPSEEMLDFALDNSGLPEPSEGAAGSA